MKPNISLDSIVVATPEHVATDLAGKTAILNLKNSTYYSLDEIGAPIWELLKQERRVAEIRDAMTQKFDVQPQQCEADLLIFLQSLAEQQLIEVKSMS